MASRKRAHQDISTDEAPHSPSLLQRIRNTWHFACLMQFIQFFGSALKIDNELDVDMLEEECVKPTSHRLAQLALTMLKWVSSHRGLTLDIFDEYTRRQYLAKAPHLNPFGEEEEALKFFDMDIFTKLKVLHQLSIWTLHNPDRIRERMPESTDKEQSTWRIEPFGEDKEGRHYFLLDDNRLYRMTDPPAAKPSPKKTKAKPKPKSSGSRASKRQKLTDGDVAEHDNGTEFVGDGSVAPDEHDGLGGAKWECLAVTLDEYRAVVEKFRRSKNADEKDIVEVLEDQAMPELVKAEESKVRKEVKRQKDLDNLQRMATAKRSSRLADKHEKQRQEDEVKAAELKRQQDLDMAHKEHDRQTKQEKDRESRMMTREQRIRDREMRRILHEEELAKLQDRSQSVDSSEAAARMSERNRANMLEKRQKDLEKIKEDEQDDWDFDCEVCGVNGKNIDDGTHSIACDRCGVWQHSKCHKITADQAERNNFKFVCARCSRPKTNIKLKLTGHGSPSSPLVNGASADGAQPVVNMPQNGQKSSSPPMGMFKVTPPTGTTRPPSTYSPGHSQQPQSNHAPLRPTFASPTNMGRRSHPTGLPAPADQQPYSIYNSQFARPPSSPLKANNKSQLAQDNQRSPLPPRSDHTPQSRPPSSGQAAQPRPPSAGYPMPNGFPQTQPPTYSPQQRHPAMNGASFTPPTHHAPPAPLSATQGNTSLRFSPTAQPPPLSPNHFGNAANLANSPRAAQAYSPSNNVPQPGSMSPVKHTSPLPPNSSFGSHPGSSFRQGLPPPMSSFQSPSKASLPAPQQRTPGQAGTGLDLGLGLDGTPTLSPTVNAHGTSTAVPVKKMTPMKAPIVPPPSFLQDDTVMTNGVENGFGGAEHHSS